MCTGNFRTRWAVAVAGAVVALLAAAQPADAQQLIPGHPRTLTGGFHANFYYYVEVPNNADRLTLRLAGGLGNADLFARFGTVGPWTHFSLHPGNHELIAIANPRHGRWWVRVFGAGAFHNTVLSADIEVRRASGLDSALGTAARLIGPMLMDRLANRSGPAPDNDGQPAMPQIRLRTLTPSVWLRDIESDDDRLEVFTVAVPENTQRLTIESAGGEGRCVLLVRRNGIPNLSANDQASAQPGTAQAVTFENPAAGAYYIRLLGATRFEDVSLRATMQAGEPEAAAAQPAIAVRSLPAGQWQQNIDSDDACVHVYTLAVPENARRLVIQTRGGQGDCVVLVRSGGIPSLTANDRAAAQPGTAQRIEIEAPPAGLCYVRLLGAPTFRGVEMMATIQPGEPGEPAAIELRSGQTLGSLNGPAGTRQYFTLTFSQPTSRLTIATRGGQGDCWVMARRGAMPTLTEFDYRSTGPGTDRLIDIRSELPAGTWYIMLYSPSGFSGVELMGQGTF